MWTILDAAAFLDPHLAFTYKENDSYFNFQCYFCLQSFHLFLNENTREPFCEWWANISGMFSIIFNRLKSGGCKSFIHTLIILQLKVVGFFKYVGHFFTTRHNFTEIWIKFGFERKQKRIPITTCTSKEATLMC